MRRRNVDINARYEVCLERVLAAFAWQPVEQVIPRQDDILHSGAALEDLDEAPASRASSPATPKPMLPPGIQSALQTGC